MTKQLHDGKFILELERAREGERVSWVSVPRKTFWSPQGTAASTPTYRQESSTSLSVSDDNSSVQSSPWQRDHSWKQATPRRNLSKELIFYYRSPKRARPRPPRQRPGSRKRRRPHSDLTGDEGNPTRGAGRRGGRPSLQAVVERLAAAGRRGAPTTTASSSSPPPRNAELVSPRKRFLREMERDAGGGRGSGAPDDGQQKRSRGKPAAPVAQAPAPAAGVIRAAPAGSPVRVNGAGTEDGGRQPTAAAAASKNCSYSITSLLADDRSSRRSPSSSPSHFVPPPMTQQQQQQQYCSPNDERWYSDSVDKLRSMDLSQAEKRGYPGYYHSLPAYPPYLHQYSLSPYYGPSLYGRGYMMPPVYHTPHLQSPIRHNVPTCSWTAEPASKDVDPRDDNVTDMPLNLSKHAG